MKKDYAVMTLNFDAFLVYDKILKQLCLESRLMIHKYR